MTKMTKILMIVSVACLALGLAFVTGIINAQNMVALYVVLPAGAIFFGLFMIFRMLEKEAALFDEEEQARRAFAEGSGKARKAQEVGGRSFSAEAAAVRH